MEVSLARWPTAVLVALAWFGSIASMDWAGIAVAAAAETQLRVCADPNHLPYSNRNGEGFENHLALRVAEELGLSLETTWWPQRRGFLRNTLDAERCDVVIGVPAQLDRVLTTRPYYRSCYAWVFREGGPHFDSIDAPELSDYRIGVHLIGDDYTNSPPAHALARRGVVENVVGYSVFGDYGAPSPLRAPVDAVLGGEIDAALIWGPIAGFFARDADPPLRVVTVPEVAGHTFAYSIAMGVRRGDEALRQRLDRVLVAIAPEIEALLVENAFPHCPKEPAPLAWLRTAAQAEIPEMAETERNPVQGNPDAIATGSKLFKKLNCSACHGGAGGGGMGPDLTDEEWKTGNGNDASLLVQVLEGRAAMPPYKGIIDEEQAWQLIAFIRTLYQGDPAKKTW